MDFSDSGALPGSIRGAHVALMGRQEIPRFFLYGEPPREIGERFLHLEALDDRSRPANWNIRPHTHANLNHVFHVTEGAGEMRADGETLAFEAPCLVLVPAGVVHGFSWVSDSRGSVLTVSEAYLAELAARSHELDQVFARPVALPRPSEKPLPEAFARLAEELAWTAPGHGVAVEALLLTILVEALRLSHYTLDEMPRIHGPQAGLVARFRELVEARYRTEMGVEDYAAALNVHPKRLRGACLAVADASPMRILQDRRLVEAKRLMLYSNMTVAETAYYLGFQDPAYFTRFFTKACNTSPGRFRRGG